jgi:GTP-binding protein Era
MEDELQKSKSGFVAVMGRPNVGKSTLINALLGQKVAAVSPRPQTTRKRQMGILNVTSGSQGIYGNVQIVFVDTPGMHRPRHKLGELMNQEAAESLEDSDLILFVADASQPPQEDDQILFDLLSGLRRNVPVILALNKIDLIDDETLQSRATTFADGIPSAKIVQISATIGSHLDDLLIEIVDRLPEGYPFFPDEQVTDLYERDIAADLIREAALNILRDEVPHGIAVRIDQFTERNGHGAYIEATIFVERESHKPIVIGKNGKMLKQIGTAARQEIEAMSGRKVFLRLRVKVRKNWRNDEKILRRFGY